MSDMAKKMSAKARAAARKQKDKWKTKRWYTIRAPRSPWNFQNIGETIGESDEHIMGRVYEMTQQEFNGDFTKMHVMLRFRVTDTAGQDALTTFVGHHHQTNHIRRQIRRYRGKIDDVMDAVTEDGYLVRIKPLIITQKRVQTSVKQAIRSKTREVVRGFIAKSTYDGLQVAMLDGSLESNIQNSIKSIYPCKSVVIRKSQLLQAGVVMRRRTNSDEIHAEEARSDAELKAKKAAALASAMEDEEEEGDDAPSILDAAEAMEPASEKHREHLLKKHQPKKPLLKKHLLKKQQRRRPQQMTVAELKELLKAAGKPVSGKKADLIARLNE